MPATVALVDLPDLVGTDLGPSPWITVEQQRIDTFADATDDHQWIHVDAARAEGGPFGTTIAHGYLTLSMLIPLWEQVLEVDGVTTKVNYGLNRVRFPSPVPSGSAIRLAASIAAVTEIEGGVQVVVDATIEAEGAAKPVCIAQPVFRLYP